MSEKTVINITSAPAPVGPYSQAVKCDNMLFISGQLGMDAASGQLVGPDAASQAKAALDNLQEILDSVDNGGMGRIVRTTIFLADMADFAAVNKIYAEYFLFEPPARSCVQVAALPKGARVEIDAIAMLPQQASGASTGMI